MKCLALAVIASVILFVIWEYLQWLAETTDFTPPLGDVSASPI